MSLLSPHQLLRLGASNLAPLFTAAAGWMIYSRLGIDHAVELPPAVEAERHYFSSAAGRLGYYADRSGSGRPLVLLHSINAAASAYEMRPLFDHYRGARPVYALDLPGFGISDRADRDYSPHLYRDAILDFLHNEVGAEADVIALSLSSEFAALAANLRPSAVHSLALISPTGLNSEGRGGDTPRARRLHRGLSLGLWRQPLYDLLVTRPSLKFFLGRSSNGAVDPGLAHYAFLTSHQPGAAHAPLSFISGRLFSPAIAESSYVRLQQPTLVIYDQDPYISFARLPEMMTRNENWRSIRLIPTRGLPHWERLPETVAALEAFWVGSDVRGETADADADASADIDDAASEPDEASDSESAAD